MLWDGRSAYQTTIDELDQRLFPENEVTNETESISTMPNIPPNTHYHAASTIQCPTTRRLYYNYDAIALLDRPTIYTIYPSRSEAESDTIA
jgi:hypothetical protein